MISPFTDTFCVSPNSEPKPTVHPAVTLESLCEGHPVKPAAGIVGWETVLHQLSARSLRDCCSALRVHQEPVPIGISDPSSRCCKPIGIDFAVVEETGGHGRAPRALLTPPSP